VRAMSASLRTHINEELTTLVTCWKITLRDTTVKGYTSHTRDLTFSSQLYKASSGYTPTAIEQSSDLAVDNLEIQGFLDNAEITEAELMAGRWDYALVEIFRVNYADLSMGKDVLKVGRLGEVQMKVGQFVAELRGLSQHMTTQIVELTTPHCRADLGDARCGVTLASFTVAGTVTTATSRKQFTDSSRGEGTGTYNGGMVTFTSGLNNGLKMEVKTFTAGGVVVLFLNLPYNIQVGDTYSMSRGCDKTLSTCINTYGQVANFRGEPHIPGIDKIMQGP